MLIVKQGGIKYHFLNFWYDLTWDWIPVSQTIGEVSQNTLKYNFILLLFLKRLGNLLE